MVLITLEGYRRGFLNSLISLARFIIGVPIAMFVCNTYSLDIYDRFVKDAALDKIAEKLQNSADLGAAVENVKQAVCELPFNLGSIVDLSFLDKAQSASLTNEIVLNIVQPIAILIIKFVLFLLTLVIFYVITLIIVNLLSDIIKVIRLKKADRFLGAVFGIIKAATVISVVAAALLFVAEIGLGEDKSEFIKQINSSSVLEFVNKYNPILSIM